MEAEKKGKSFMHRSAEGDFFQTPYPMTRALLDREKFPKLILEPASGRGAITRVLRERGHVVTDYDLETGGETGPKDFLEEHRRFPAIITNPPYSLADQFVMKAKGLRPKKFAFLLRTNYLSGQARLEAGIFKGLARVYVFSRMPDLRAPIREDGLSPTAGIVYAWMVWVKGYSRPTTLHHIDYQHGVITTADYDLDYANELIKRKIIKKLPPKLQERNQ
jgi:hypothetical protein